MYLAKLIDDYENQIDKLKRALEELLSQKEAEKYVPIAPFCAFRLSHGLLLHCIRLELLQRLEVSVAQNRRDKDRIEQLLAHEEKVKEDRRLEQVQPPLCLALLCRCVES